MGAANRDRELQSHQLGQHFGAPNQGNAALAGRHHLRVGRLHGGGIDDGGDALADVRGVMADEHPRAQLFQPFGIGRSLGIRPLHRITDLEHDFGDPAHADAADTDEMNRTEVERNGAKASDHQSVITRDLQECTIGNEAFSRP